MEQLGRALMQSMSNREKQQEKAGGSPIKEVEKSEDTSRSFRGYPMRPSAQTLANERSATQSSTEEEAAGQERNAGSVPRR